MADTDIEIINITRQKSIFDGTENLVGQDAGGGVDSTWRGDLNDLSSFINTAVGFVGTGNKINRAAPVFGFRDWEGTFLPDPAGGDAPSYFQYSANNRALGYAVGDKFETSIHVPHDCIPSTDHFFHPHALTNGSLVTGNLGLTMGIHHILGDNRAGDTPQDPIFLTLSLDISAAILGKSATPDTLFMAAGGGINLLDSDLILPDDTIKFSGVITALPVITGGTSLVGIEHLDIHANTTGIPGTVNKDNSTGTFYAV